MRGANNTMDTINAAANAIASAENRMPHASFQKRRWGSCWSLTWCFGSQNQRKRIGHAVLVPEPSPSGTEASRIQHPTQQPSIVLPFQAPPSSPASFLQSEPPSASQSPTGLISFTSISANMHSPGPPSMFAIGPYAYETQLVSPPVFSTFNTEPSTAPFTPPPESVHLTTPSSPEVPFARLLDPTNQNGGVGQRFPLSHYEFQSYQLYPGSPVGQQLISPSSGISGSGTSSPLPDIDFARSGPHFLEFPVAASSKLDKFAARDWGSCQQSGSITPDALVPRSRDGPHVLEFPVGAFSKSEKLDPSEWDSRQGSGTMTPEGTGQQSRDGYLLDRQNSDVGPLMSFANGGRNDESIIDHRVSFEITAEEVIRCVERRRNRTEDASNGQDCRAGETSGSTSERGSVDGEDGNRHRKQRSSTLGSVKEFNFDSADGVNCDKPNIGPPDWWAANEEVNEKDNGQSKNWSFFPMIQPGVS